jgi:hypothetical protein
LRNRFSPLHGDARLDLRNFLTGDIATSFDIFFATFDGALRF